MKLTLNINKFVLYCISLICMIAFLHMIPDINGSVRLNKEQCLSAGTLVIVVMITQLFFLRKFMEKNRMILYALWGVIYIFNFGQLVLYAVGYELSPEVFSASAIRFFPDYMIPAAYVALRGIIGLYMGVTLYLVFMVRNDEAKYLHGKESLYQPTKNLTYFLLVFGMAADFGYNIVYAMTTGAYTVGAEESIMITFLRICSYLSSTAIVMLMAQKDVGLKAKRAICIFFIIYKMICMFSGFRAFALINIILVVYSYYRVCGRIKLSFKHVILLLIGAQVGSGFLAIIRDTRSTGIDLLTVLKYCFTPFNGAILDVISEFGATLNIVCVALEQLRGVGSGGLQVISSLMSIIPGVGRIFPDINFAEMNLDTKLGIHSMGGSFIGDMLFDFGTKGILVACVFLGIAYCAFVEKYERALQRGNMIYAAVALPIMVDLIYCVRSSLYKMPRQIVWYLLIYSVFHLMFMQRRRSRTF